MNIYQIADHLRVSVEALENTPEEELQEAVKSFIQQTEGKLEDKIEAYCSIIKEQKMLTEAAREEASRLGDLARSRENFYKNLNKRLRDVMVNVLHRPKIETPRFKLNVQNPGGVRGLNCLVGAEDSQGQYILTDEEAATILPVYVKTVKMIDKDEVRKELLAYDREVAAIDPEYIALLDEMRVAIDNANTDEDVSHIRKHYETEHHVVKREVAYSKAAEKLNEEYAEVLKIAALKPKEQILVIR